MAHAYHNHLISVPLFADLDENASVHALVSTGAFVRLDLQHVSGDHSSRGSAFRIQAWHACGPGERGSKSRQSARGVPRGIRARSDALCEGSSSSNSRSLPNCACAVAQCCHNTGGVQPENCDS